MNVDEVRECADLILIMNDLDRRLAEVSGFEPGEKKRLWDLREKIDKRIRELYRSM